MTLASGEKTRLKITTRELCCLRRRTLSRSCRWDCWSMTLDVRWSGAMMERRLHTAHPTRGLLPVNAKTTGCPQVPRQLALDLIEVAGSEACKELLEVDILRGESHDMMNDDGPSMTASMLHCFRPPWKER